MANDLISCACVMKPNEEEGSESFLIGEHVRFREGGVLGEGIGSPVPFPH